MNIFRMFAYKSLAYGALGINSFVIVIAPVPLLQML